MALGNCFVCTPCTPLQAPCNLQTGLRTRCFRARYPPVVFFVSARPFHAPLSPARRSCNQPNLNSLWQAARGARRERRATASRAPGIPRESADSSRRCCNWFRAVHAAVSSSAAVVVVVPPGFLEMSHCEQQTGQSFAGETGLHFAAREIRRETPGPPSMFLRQSDPFDLPWLDPMSDAASTRPPRSSAAPPTSRSPRADCEVRSLFGQRPCLAVLA